MPGVPLGRRELSSASLFISLLRGVSHREKLDNSNAEHEERWQPDASAASNVIDALNLDGRGTASRDRPTAGEPRDAALRSRG